MNTKTSTGNYSTGNYSTGDHSTGYWSTGDHSTGDHSTGSYSTGHWSTGHWSTGDHSTGNWSTGNWSTGNYSTGHWSTGNYSTGHWSTTDRDTGHFNTINPKTINVFNKPCSIEVWEKAKKPKFLYFNLTEWVPLEEMSQKEKQEHPSCETANGYLKVFDYKEAFQRSWEKASEEDKSILFDLPNFDADVFKEISGIDVTKEKKVSI